MVTIRLNILKLGARITVSVRRILIAIAALRKQGRSLGAASLRRCCRSALSASSCPYQDILSMAYSRIQAIPDTG